MAGALVTAASRFGGSGPIKVQVVVFVEAKEMCVFFWGRGKVKHREKGGVCKVGSK